MEKTEASRLIKEAKRMGELYHEKFRGNAASYIEGLVHEEKIESLRKITEAENNKLQKHVLPDFFVNKEAIIEALTLDSTESQKEAMFQEWYSCFSSIEGDRSFLRLVIKHNPELLQDGLFISERNSFQNQEDAFVLSQSTFYWNAHLIVLVFYFYTQHNIAYLQKEIAGLRDTGKGLNCLLSIEEKKKLYDGLIRKKIIDATENNFIAAMTNEPLPLNFEKVKWILTGKENKPHKTALREFLDMYCKPTHGKSTNVPHQEEINRIFCDAGENPIILAKPTRGKPSNYYADLENLIE